jgi:hypothetical protein
MGGAVSTVNTGGTTDTTGAFKIIKPAPGARVTKGYNATGGAHPRPHKGIDYGTAIGSKIVAAAAGTVQSVGGSTANTYGKKGGGRSYGLHIIINHGNGYSTVYAHLSSAQVSAGMQVAQGQVIALSGNSGYSTGPHLHFEARKNGTQIDPQSVMGGGGVTITEGSAKSSQVEYSGDTSTSSIIGEINTGEQAAATPSGYTGASIAGSAVSALAGGGSHGNIGHGASTVGANASVGSGTGGGPEDVSAVGRSSAGNNVTINVSVANASAAEAERLAVMVKEYLDNDRLISNMGRM